MPSRPVALSGFMGAGKSTLGARLARSRGWAFVDLDEELAAAFARPVGVALVDEGEPAFRAMEGRLLRQALALPDRVVALGGGATLVAESRAVLRERATWIELDVDLREAMRRVGGDAARPLLRRSDLPALHAERAAAGVGAHGHVDATGRVEDVAARLDAALEQLGLGFAPTLADVPPCVVPVEIAGACYEVHVGRGVLPVLCAHLDRVGAGRVALVTDWTVGPRHEDAVRAALAEGREVVPVTLPAGEARKEVGPVLEAVDRLLDAGWDRASPIVALGGGVLGDMAGLVAALLLRGVPFLPLPTTLLAMVDSSVGGKVGVNHRRGKNLIGSFHQPDLVVAELSFLDTLPDRELRAGLAEVVKIALLFDPPLLDALESEPDRLLARDPALLQEVVRRCVAWKARVVAEDAQERGRRRLLNLGHTVGHGLEAALGYGALRHGEAVAIGLVAAAELAAERGGDPSIPGRIRLLLRALGLPVRSPPVLLRALRDAVAGDKKLNRDAISWILMDAIGAPCIVPLPLGQLDSVLERLVGAGVITQGGDEP